MRGPDGRLSCLVQPERERGPTSNSPRPPAPIANSSRRTASSSHIGITRCKLGLAPPNLREWHIALGLSQLDQAFAAVSERTDPIESFHQAVNSKVRDIFFALYRDFPDPHRVTGQEKF
jgi:hypothetical protein